MLPSWARLKTVLGYLLTIALMVGTVIAVQSQSIEEEPSAEGQLRKYYGRNQAALYPTDPDPGLYPNEVYPGDWPPLYPGDEKWDGQLVNTFNYDVNVRSLATDGQSVYVGGRFAWEPYFQISRWENDRWYSFLGNPYISDTVDALALEGSNLYAGGKLDSVSPLQVKNIAHWNGSQWDDMGGGVTDETGSGGTVARIAVSGGDVYVVGTFTRAGITQVSNIARWDGSTWHDLGGGLNGPAYALAVSGSDVYAGGDFTSAGGQPAANIAHWDGKSWQALGSGTDGVVYALAAQGGSVYAGGNFKNAGGQTVNAIARWDGSQWQPLGSGLESTVTSVAAAPEGVYAGGNFSVVLGEYSAYGIAFWNGAGWTNLGSGTCGDGDTAYGSINDILPLGNKVFAGGRFMCIGNNESNGFGIWNRQPDASTYQIEDTPVAPGSTIYLYGEFFTPGAPVELSIEGAPAERTLYANADGKVYVRLLTTREDADGAYTYTFKSAGVVASGSFVLQSGAQVYTTAWDGKTIPYPDYPIHLPLVRK